MEEREEETAVWSAVEKETGHSSGKESKENLSSLNGNGSMKENAEVDDRKRSMSPSSLEEDELFTVETPVTSSKKSLSQGGFTSDMEDFGRRHDPLRPLKDSFGSRGSFSFGGKTNFPGGFGPSSLLEKEGPERLNYPSGAHFSRKTLHEPVANYFGALSSVPPSDLDSSGSNSETMVDLERLQISDEAYSLDKIMASVKNQDWETVAAKLTKEVTTLSNVTNLLKTTLANQGHNVRQEMTKLKSLMEEEESVKSAQMLDLIYKLDTRLNNWQERVEMLLRMNDFHQKTREMLYWFYAVPLKETGIYAQVGQGQPVETLKAGQKVLLSYPQHLDERRHVWMQVRRVCATTLTVQLGYVKVFDTEKILFRAVND